LFVGDPPTNCPNLLRRYEKGKLLEIVKQRVNDGGIIRLIGKWLNAGVMEGAILTISEKGTPQGGVITPPTILQKV
jgi:retron-type reverse transcriptase